MPDPPACRVIFAGFWQVERGCGGVQALFSSSRQEGIPLLALLTLAAAMDVGFDVMAGSRAALLFSSLLKSLHFSLWEPAGGQAVRCEVGKPTKTHA